jgi:hypothetical protein
MIAAPIASYLSQGRLRPLWRAADRAESRVGGSMDPVLWCSIAFRSPIPSTTNGRRQTASLPHIFGFAEGEFLEPDEAGDVSGAHPELAYNATQMHMTGRDWPYPAWLNTRRR